MTRIGLLSDSHGRGNTTERAVQLLLDQAVDRLIHLGDIGTMEVLEALVLSESTQPAVPVQIVFGNCDWDDEALRRYARALGIEVCHPVGRIDCDGKQIVFLHSHDEAAMLQALADRPDYLFHGHTHRQTDETIGGVRVINPGALFRAAVYSVAVVDVQADEVTFHELLPGLE